MPDDKDAATMLAAGNSAVTAHINLIQGIINRLANNSASCKTWCLTLVGALVSLASATHAPGMITFALVAVAIFGFMDTMYLASENAYRDLYNSVVNAVREGAYAPGNLYEAKAAISGAHIVAALKSWSIWPVYGGLIAAYIVARYAGWLNVLAAAPKQGSS